MRKLFIENSWLARFLKNVAIIIDKWWVKYFVIPILTVLPAALISFHIKAKVEDIPRSDGNEFFHVIHNLAVENPLLVVLAVTLYLIIFNAIVAFISSFNKKEDGVDIEGLLTLFAVFEKIVSAKGKRFGQCAKEVCGAKSERVAKASDAFKKITQPDQQIALLANGLHAFFDSIDKEGVSFKVTIAAIENGQPIEWFYFYPDSEPPRTPFRALQDENSSISYCLKTKKIVIIEDIQKEASKGADRHFVPRLPDDDEEGSLICYPIIHHYTHSIPYVVTVVADKRGYFSNNKKQLYKWIFNHFSLRIGLEHSLLVIKKGCADEAKSG